MWQGQCFLKTVLNPMGCVACAADWTVAMITAVVKEVMFFALCTVALVPAHKFSAALKDSLQCFALFEAQRVTVARKERCIKSLNDLRYGVNCSRACRVSAGV